MMNNTTQQCCCSCGCSNESVKKEVKIDYLYLDLNTCDRCIGTDMVLEEVIKELIPAFDLAGYAVTYNKIEIATEELAVKYRFVSSPTIRVNGHDICDDVKESDCGCCGEISGTQVDCRVFEYDGELYEVPPKAMLAEAVLRNAFKEESEPCCCYVMPDNLKMFFKGKSKKQSCCCAGSCC
jgi:hypothetical protein